MSESSLHCNHTAAGATFVDVFDWSLPGHYGDVTAEYEVVRGGAGIVDLSHRGKICMTGGDRQAFLHRIVTNEIRALNPGDGTYACMLTPQGKIISDMTVYVSEDHLLLDTESGMVPVLMETLDRYALMDDVVMEDATEQWALIGVVGPMAMEILGGLSMSIRELAYLQHVMSDFQGQTVMAVRSHRTAETSYDVYVKADQAEAFWNALLEQGGKRIGLEVMEILRIEAGIPRYGAELDERIIPNEAVRERAVSFQKGCYVGQEPVVMMEHRGRPNRMLTGLKIDGDTLPAKDAVLKKDGQDAGWITSTVHGKAVDGVLALAFVRRKYMNVGDRLTVETSGVTKKAEIVPLPFVLAKEQGHGT